MLGVLPSFKVLSSRLFHAAFTLPHLSGLRNVLLAVAIINAAVVGLGVSSGMYKWQPLPDARVLGWSAAYVMMRTVPEEIIFRALMLPHPKADGAQAMQPLTFALHAIVPLALFMVSHLWTTQRQPNAVAHDAKFFATLAVCGLACTWAYWVTGGGLWAAMLAHWTIVFPWVVLLGGYAKTHTPTPLMAKRAGGRGLGDLAPAEEPAMATFKQQ